MATTYVIPALRAYNVIIRGTRREAAEAVAAHFGSRPLANVRESALATHGTVWAEDSAVLLDWFRETTQHRREHDGEPLAGDLTWYHGKEKR